MDDMILAKDIPDEFHESAIQAIMPFTITFLHPLYPEDINGRPEWKLRGSGVLVEAGGKKAILTAEHVIANLPDADRIGLFLEKTDYPHSVDTAGLAFVRVAPRGRNESQGPDLAVAILAPPIGSAIAARRVL